MIHFNFHLITFPIYKYSSYFLFLFFSQKEIYDEVSKIDFLYNKRIII